MRNIDRVAFHAGRRRRAPPCSEVVGGLCVPFSVDICIRASTSVSIGLSIRMYEREEESRKEKRKKKRDYQKGYLLSRFSDSTVEEITCFSCTA